MNGRILIDTLAFYALISDTDEFHQRAVSTYAELIDQRAELYTTSYVLVETKALIHRRLGFRSLPDFIDSMRESVSVMGIDRHTHWRSWEILKFCSSEDLI
jgi:uncharacterized protein